MEPSRFWSVGGNGIKLYSNMRPNASLRCDQSAICSYAILGLPRLRLPQQPGLPNATLEVARSKSPTTAILSPLPLFATRSETLRGFCPPVKSDPVHRILEYPPKSENHHAICRNRKGKRSHSGRHPQPVHKARLIIRRMPPRSKKNLSVVDPTQAPLRRRKKLSS